MKTPNLELHLLGPVEIFVEHEHLKIPRRVERAILYYLAGDNKPASRTTLIDLIWPDAEQVDPRAALRTALSRLRNTLPRKDLLVTELDQVSLDFSSCQVDLLRFEKSYLSLQGILAALPSHKVLSGQIVNQIQEALNLWHGDQVIQGDDFHAYPEFEAWRQMLNRNLCGHRQFLIKRLGDHFQVCGQLERAVDLFTQLGRLNHLDITSHLAVVNLLTKLGRHQEALDYCDALEIIFERLYSAPLPDELLECCRQAQMLIDGIHRRQGQDWPVTHSVQLPLFGRNAELEMLRGAFFSGGLVKIQGERGVGKTRLVQELFESLLPRPMLILAPAREGEGSLPFAPIIHGLRRHVSDEVWREIDCVWANQLTLLFPELTNIRPDCNLSFSEKMPSARQHLFDAVHHLLELVANRNGRLLFFLDDAQWADQQTLQALSYLVEQGFFDKNGLLIVAGHAENPGWAMDKFFDPFNRTHQGRTIDLPGLKPEEVRNLAQHVLHELPSTAFIDQLYRETDGNPLMVLEIIRHLLEKPMDSEALHNLDRLPVPDSIHGLIRSRINHLSEDARQILTCASVIGNDISLGLLRNVTDLRQQPFFLALDALIQADILHTNAGEPTHGEHLLFSHEIMREVVLNEIPLTYQQTLHRQIANGLSRQPDSSDKAAVIANHYLAGGDVLNAFEWLIKAADHAWNLGAREDVLRAYQQAEEILNYSPEGMFKVDQFSQLYAQWSDFAYQSNQVDLLDEVGVKLQQLAKQKTDDRLMGLSNLSLANACFLREDYETGFILIQNAVKALRKTHHPELLMRALFYQASFQWWMLDFDGVIESSEQILKTLDSLPSENQNKDSFQFAVQRLIAFTFHARGEPERAVETAENAYHAFFAGLSSFDRLRGYHMLTTCHYMAGHIDQSAYYAQEALKIAQALENTVIETLSLINFTKVEIVQGHIDKAFQHITRALKLAEKSNKIQDIVAANMLLGDIFNILQNINQALQYFRIAQVRQGYFFQSYFGLENNIHLARILTRSGQLTEARELLNSTLAVSEQKGVMQLHIQALMADGLIDIEEHQYTAAEQKFNLAIELADQRGLHNEVVWGEFRMALLAFSQGQYDQAEKFLMDLLENPNSHEMVMMLKLVLEFAFQLSEFKTLQLNLDELRLTYQMLVAHLDEHTQSPPLRQDFLNAQRLWREKGYFS